MNFFLEAQFGAPRRPRSGRGPGRRKKTDAQSAGDAHLILTCPAAVAAAGESSGANRAITSVAEASDVAGGSDTSRTGKLSNILFYSTST